MPNTFIVKTHRGIGTANTTVNGYAVGVGVTGLVIGLSLSNLTGNTVNVNIYHSDGTNSTSIAKSVPILTGATLVAAGGEEKIVLQNAHSIIVSSDTAASLDVVMSVLEMS